MLPNQASSLPLGYHRRQKSTPTVPIAPKVSLLPAMQKQHGNHRRGLSLDQVIYEYKPQELSQQDEQEVSIDQGLSQHQQHTTREAQQQQQPMARPGQSTKQEPLYRNDSRRYIQPYPEQDFGTGHTTDNDLTKESFNTKDLLDFISKYSVKQISHHTSSNISAGYLDGFGNELIGSDQDSTYNGGMDAFQTPSYDDLPGSLGPEKKERREEPIRPSTPVNQTITSKLKSSFKPTN